MLAAGVLVYFALPAEPAPFWGPGGLAGAGAIAALAWRLRARLPWLGVAALALAAAGAGFSLALLRTASVEAPILEARLGPVTVRGVVEQVSVRSARDMRVLLRPESVERVAEDRLPAKVRLRLRGAMPALQPGDRIGVLATLMPPQGPVAPGAFDFARRAYFDRIGAVGFSLGAPEVIGRAPPRGLWDRLAQTVERTRAGLTRHIQERLGPQIGGLAAALVTGDRGGLAQSDYEALRDAGLAHLVAISGLHMGLVGGLAFFALRAGLAAVPGLALRYPIKKWAALAALAAAAGYLALSGAPVSAQRAFLMLGLVFGAVLVDRPALTLRTVALAALVMITLTPEAVLEAGFQMSFAAVIALVAAYEVVSARARPEGRGLLLRVGLGLGAIVFSSLVAGFATAPYAAYHFGQFANGETIANLGAMPLMSFLVMPSAMLAAMLTPMGLDAPFWALMGLGLGGILGIGEWISAAPFAVTRLPAGPPAAILILTFALLWLCLWRGPIRLGAGLFAGLGILIWSLAPQPDILIGAGAKQVAVRLDDGRLSFASERKQRYEAERWLQRDGDGRALRAAAQGPGRTCDGEGCVFLRDGQRIALAWSRAALEDDCRGADIVIARFPVRACNSARVLIDWVDLKRRGTHAVFLEEGQARLRTVAQARGDRPWARHHGR